MLRLGELEDDVDEIARKSVVVDLTPLEGRVGQIEQVVSSMK